MLSDQVTADEIVLDLETGIMPGALSSRPKLHWRPSGSRIPSPEEVMRDESTDENGPGLGRERFHPANR